MTPLVMKMVKYFPDAPAEQYTWFDISEYLNSTTEKFNHERALQALQNPLPFDKCAIVGEDEYEVPFILLLSNTVLPSNDMKGLAVHMQILHKDGIGICPPFFVSPEQALIENSTQGMPIYFVDEKEAANPQNTQAGIDALITASFWLERLNQQPIPAYTATPKSNNAKRIRHGKKPLFDWHTVTIEPPKPKAEAQGGTHASPRLHDVRGHWVKRGDKRFWRKAHQRGDASIGVVFHDYKLKGEANGKQTA